MQQINDLKKIIDLKIFLPFFILLNFIALINSLQTYFIYHKTINPFILLLLTKLIYNWYFIIIAFVVLILVRLQLKSNRLKIISNVVITTLIICIHQALLYGVESYFLIKKSYSNFYQVIFYNPLVWLDIVMVIFFYLGFYLIKYKNQVKENELKSYQLKEKLSLTKLHELKSKINPDFLHNALDKIAEFIKHHKTKDADNLLNATSDFLRTTLYHERSYSSLNQEINFIEKFLIVKRIITGRKLFLKKNVSEVYNDLLIPSFSLLYAIENLVNIDEEIIIEIISKIDRNDLMVLINFKTENAEEDFEQKLYDFIKNNNNIYLVDNDDSYSLILRIPLIKENQLDEILEGD